ncbi:MAG: DoxX family membrane protein [Rhizobiaceae bacterium]
MTMAMPASKTSLLALPGKIEALIAKLVLPSFASLILRFALAVPFFKSGLTKWDGFLFISDTPLLLFTEEFKLHIFGQVYDYPFPALMAWGSSLGEIILPILLVLGLLTRLSAFGILVMTAMIQLTIPDGWANFHLPWAAMAIAIILIGAGKLSLDALLKRA